MNNYLTMRKSILRIELGFDQNSITVWKPGENANSSGETRPSKSYTVVLNGIIPRDAEVGSRRLFSLPNKRIWHVSGSSPAASDWQKHRRCKSQWCPISGRQWRPTLIHRIPFYLSSGWPFSPIPTSVRLRSCPVPEGFAENRKSRESAYVYFCPFTSIPLRVPPSPGKGREIVIRANDPSCGAARRRVVYGNFAVASVRTCVEKQFDRWIDRSIDRDSVRRNEFDGAVVTPSSVYWRQLELPVGERQTAVKAGNIFLLFFFFAWNCYRASEGLEGRYNLSQVYLSEKPTRDFPP